MGVKWVMSSQDALCDNKDCSLQVTIGRLLIVHCLSLRTAFVHGLRLIYEANLRPPMVLPLVSDRIGLIFWVAACRRFDCNFVQWPYLFLSRLARI